MVFKLEELQGVYIYFFFFLISVSLTQSFSLTKIETDIFTIILPINQSGNVFFPGNTFSTTAKHSWYD